MNKFIGAAWLLTLLTQAAFAQNAEIYRTARDNGERLAKSQAKFTTGMPDEHHHFVMVDETKKFQEIAGIGGAVTDSAAETFARLRPAEQERFLKAYYDPNEGAGYSLARTNIHSCDFSSGSYTYVQPGDVELRTFTLEHDRRHRIPLLLKIRKVAPDIKVFASPWSPPAWMKDNNDMLHGGKLKPEFADTWARYVVKFLEGYRQAGIPMWGLTVQNEPLAVQPWESCIFTSAEERDFVKNHLGPRLRQAGLKDLKLMVWDHNRGLAYERGSAILSDPQAAQYVWGTAYHWYDGEQFDNLRMLHEAFPEKAVFFSEGCHGPFSWARFNDWNWGEGYGHSMINDFNHWASGWCDWNVLLDDKGGPNHVSNFCFAPLHENSGKLETMNSYYYISHFSRFIRPGARRLACTCTMTSLEATAFVNLDGSRVAVTMNRTDQDLQASVWSGGKAVPFAMPKHSIVTVRW